MRVRVLVSVIFSLAAFMAAGEFARAADTVPLPPANLQAPQAGMASAVALSWDPSPSPGVDWYYIYRSTSAASQGNRVGPIVTGTSYADYEVSYQQTYYYRVVAILDDVPSAASEQAVVTLVLPKPEYVTASSVSGTNSLIVRWNRPSLGLILRFDIERSTQAGRAGSIIGSNIAGTEFLDSNVEAGVTYYYRVRSVSQTNIRSEFTEAVAGKVEMAAAPSAPVISGTLSGQNITVNWTHPLSRTISAYLVYRSENETELGDFKVRTSDRTFREYALERGHTYFYRIKAVDIKGNMSQESEALRVIVAAARSSSPSSAAPARTSRRTTRQDATSQGKAKPPGARDLRVSDVGNGSALKLVWNNPDPIAYEFLNIYRSTDKAARGNLLVSRFRGAEYTDRTIAAPGQGYYYTIATVAKDGTEGTLSAPARGISARLLPQEAESLDIDGDGLPNLWEREHGYHPHLADPANLDDDNDGLGVKEEYEYGTNPWDSDTDNDGFADGTEVRNNYNPNGPGALVKSKTPASNQGNLRYGIGRLSDITQEAAYAEQLRQELEKVFGKGKIPNPKSHWATLVSAYVYGDYTAEEIAATLKYGPGLVHPNIPASSWRESPQYAKAAAKR